MKKLSLFILLLLVAFTILGCSGGLTGGGSGGGANNSARDNGGSMTLTVNWPGVGKAIPSSAYSIKVNVCAQVQQDGITKYNREVNAALIIRRNTSASTESVTINGIPSGSKTVIAQAYDGSATEVAYGTRSVTIVQGDNSGATVTLSSGTFPYSIIGPGDVTTPTSGGGGSTTTTTYSYLFVNNYSGNSISAIKETKTTTTSSGSSTSTYSAAVDGTISGVTQPLKGVFDSSGTYYYATSATNPPAVYKITPSTSSWSASTVNTAFFVYNAGYVFQEILYDSGYLYVPYKYRKGAYDAAGILKVSASGERGTISYGSNELSDAANDCKIVGLYRAAANKLIVAYTVGFSNLYIAVCNDTGATLDIVIGGKQALTGLVTSPVGLLFYVSGITMSDASTVLVPGAYPDFTHGRISNYMLNSDDSLTYKGQYLTSGMEPYFRKVLYNSPTTYALSTRVEITPPPNPGSYLFYGTLTSMQTSNINSWSTSDFGDMAFSSDKTRMYMTDFGITAGTGSSVYIKTLSSPDVYIAPLTVGCSPFGITLKP